MGPSGVPLFLAKDVDYSIFINISKVENGNSTNDKEEEKPSITGKENSQRKSFSRNPSIGFKKSKKDPLKEAEIQRIIAELQTIDMKVKAHEMAHASVGGQYAGAPSYTYVRGPDGRLYAVAGEVPIDVSPKDTPEKTIRKMEQVIAAALAPADPSPQDMAVAAKAAQILQRALMEYAKQKAENSNPYNLDNLGKGSNIPNNPLKVVGVSKETDNVEKSPISPRGGFNLNDVNPVLGKNSANVRQKAGIIVGHNL